MASLIHHCNFNPSWHLWSILSLHHQSIISLHHQSIILPLSIHLSIFNFWSILTSSIFDVSSLLWSILTMHLWSFIVNNKLKPPHRTTALHKWQLCRGPLCSNLDCIFTQNKNYDFLRTPIEQIPGSSMMVAVIMVQNVPVFHRINVRCRITSDWFNFRIS